MAAVFEVHIAVCCLPTLLVVVATVVDAVVPDRWLQEGVAGVSSISPPRRRFASLIAWGIGRRGERNAVGGLERPGARGGPMIPFGKRELKVCILGCLFGFARRKCWKSILGG